MERDDTCENIISLMADIFAENLDVEGLRACESDDDEEDFGER